MQSMIYLHIWFLNFFEISCLKILRIFALFKFVWTTCIVLSNFSERLLHSFEKFRLTKIPIQTKWRKYSMGLPGILPLRFHWQIICVWWIIGFRVLFVHLLWWVALWLAADDVYANQGMSTHLEHQWVHQKIQTLWHSIHTPIISA